MVSVTKGSNLEEVDEKGLPAYAGLLKAFHREFADELQDMLRSLPIRQGDEVLEVATGDGKFAVWLNELVGSEGKVTAVDISQSWLRDAAHNVKKADAEDVALEQADATKLPYDDGSFDFVWCAQSLYSLPRTLACLSEMRRVLRPGGYLAILENDSMHHVLLPWPPQLELRIMAAELKAAQATADQPAKYYVGRWLSRLLRKAGLKHPQERSFAHSRQQPLSTAATEYFASYLESLQKRVAPFLSLAARQRLDQLLDAGSRHCLWKQRDFVAVCIDRVVWAQK